MSVSVRPSIFTKPSVALATGLTVTAAAVALLVVASLRQPAQSDTSHESSATATAYAMPAHLSLVVDLTSGKLRLQMDDVTVWDATLLLASDTHEIASFVESLNREDIRAAFIRRVHLFGGSRPVSDSILAIVARAENLPVHHMQRYIPERFLIELSNGSCIDVVTDVSGEAVSRFENALETGRVIWRSFSGNPCLRLKLPGKEGMSLYGASRQGMIVVAR